MNNFTLERAPQYRYAGKCRHCGWSEQWVAGPSMTWEDFYRVTKSQCFPSFIVHCESCDNQAVYDLTAISGAP